MTEASVEARITAVLKSLKPEAAAALTPQTDLFEAGVLDSFGVLEFIAALEGEFGIRIPNDDLLPQNLWSVEAAARTVQKRLR